MNKEENQCSELSKKTMDILDNNVLVNLFVSTQQNNLDLCIEMSIKWVFSFTYVQSIQFEHVSIERLGTQVVGAYYI